nr:MAG TPA: hypothetical protein [Caudoviricetes sp.]
MHIMHSSFLIYNSAPEIYFTGVFVFLNAHRMLTKNINFIKSVKSVKIKILDFTVFYRLYKIHKKYKKHIFNPAKVLCGAICI